MLLRRLCTGLIKGSTPPDDPEPMFRTTGRKRLARLSIRVDSEIVCSVVRDETGRGERKRRLGDRIKLKRVQTTLKVPPCRLHSRASSCRNSQLLRIRQISLRNSSQPHYFTQSSTLQSEAFCDYRLGIQRSASRSLPPQRDLRYL